MLVDDQLYGNEPVDKDWVKITCKIGAIQFAQCLMYGEIRSGPLASCTSSIESKFCIPCCEIVRLGISDICLGALLIVDNVDKFSLVNTDLK